MVKTNFVPLDAFVQMSDAELQARVRYSIVNTTTGFANRRVKFFIFDADMKNLSILNFHENSVRISDFAKNETYANEGGKQKLVGGGLSFKISYGEMTLTNNFPDPATGKPADIAAYVHAKKAAMLMKILAWDATMFGAMSESQAKFGTGTPFGFVVDGQQRSTGPKPPLTYQINSTANYPKFASMFPKLAIYDAGIPVDDMVNMFKDTMMKSISSIILAKYQEKRKDAAEAYFTQYLPFVDFRTAESPTNTTAVVQIKANEIATVGSRSLITNPSEAPLRPHLNYFTVKPWNIFGSQTPGQKMTSAICNVMTEFELFIGAKKVARTVVTCVQFINWSESTLMQDLPEFGEAPDGSGASELPDFGASPTRQISPNGIGATPTVVGYSATTAPQAPQMQQAQPVQQVQPPQQMQQAQPYAAAAPYAQHVQIDQQAAGWGATQVAGV